jgi:hypothetical protein
MTTMNVMFSEQKGIDDFTLGSYGQSESCGNDDFDDLDRQLKHNILACVKTDFDNCEDSFDNIDVLK